MTRDLAGEIHGFLAERPAGCDVETIARGIRAATHSVRQTLRDDERFSGPWKAGHGAHVTHLWKARAVKADGQGRARLTQGEQILALLSDGRFHTTAEIIRAVPCVVHSRISELRARGHVILHEGEGAGAERNRYRLATLDEAAHPVSAGSVAASSSGVGQSSSPTEYQPAPLPPRPAHHLRRARGGMRLFRLKRPETELRKPQQHTKPLTEFQDPAEIAARLAVLRAKLHRVHRYDAAVKAGSPDMSLLDLKQQQILLWHHCDNQLFPKPVRRDLGRTIDVLQTRLARLERKQAAA